MGYKRFTCEEIEKANNSSIVDYINKLSLETKRAGKTIKLEGYGGLYIDPVRNRWNCFSKGEGGGPIQLIMFLENKTWVESVKEILKNNYNNSTVRNKNNNFNEENKEFILPEKNNTYNHIIAYLIKTRQIEKSIVYEFIKEKKLYEDKKRNCVFVGYNKEKKPRYAGLRGTNTNKVFKGEVLNSDKAFSVNRPGITNKLYIFESPIELMSYLSLEKQFTYNKEFNHHTLSLGGLSTPALDKYLKDNPTIEELTLCLNNDKWGIKAAKEIERLYKNIYKMNIRLPKLKDYNEVLVFFKEEEFNKDQIKEIGDQEEDEWDMEL